MKNIIPLSNTLCHDHDPNQPYSPSLKKLIQQSYIQQPLQQLQVQVPLTTSMPNLSEFILKSPALKPSKVIYDYGDCAETIPLQVMSEIARDPRNGNPPIYTEIRSLAFYTSRIRNSRVNPLDMYAQHKPISLKDPCLNCQSLMERLPLETQIFTGSGNSVAVRWLYGSPGGPVCWEGNNPGYNKGFYQIGLTLYSPIFSGLTVQKLFNAPREAIFVILETFTLPNASCSFVLSQSSTLQALWWEFILPFRSTGSIFRLDTNGNVAPLVLHINDIPFPLCTIFCALSYIISIVWERQLIMIPQNDLSPLQPLSLLAKWSCVLCPWAHPNVVNIMYCITSTVSSTWAPIFMLGTSKPRLQSSYVPGRHQMETFLKHQAQMRSIRRQFLDNQFGCLPNLCPVENGNRSNPPVFFI